MISDEPETEGLTEPEKEELNEWMAEQLELKKQLVCEDLVAWDFNEEKEEGKEVVEVKHVGGVDISFIKGDDVNAVASLVILTFPALEVVYEHHEKVKLTRPYICGYLAYRELPHLAPLFTTLKEKNPELFPQIVFVDGNGYLHPRGFGLACQLGVELGIPTIGVGKNFLQVDGLTIKGIKQKVRENCSEGGDFVEIKGDSGTVWGAALLGSDGTTSPIYISVGHMVSLKTAVHLSTLCCTYRIPEPVRQADLKSRDFIRQRWHTVDGVSGWDLIS
eukprot:CAMPEP_0174266954 /NCGR_PEP_ID=MMETSP0439-20130205/31986_1 /TAXON_ID=0 /ORGANISM="Stereomyxa ramosa, Strain Chinc5" /LENGTH=275 /DNA_ID=CAMNT_0015354225 /DNA_START=45 /DNA_END=872 /DNA_ORIENTATION=-